MEVTLLYKYCAIVMPKGNKLLWEMQCQNQIGEKKIKGKTKPEPQVVIHK